MFWEQVFFLLALTNPKPLGTSGGDLTGPHKFTQVPLQIPPATWRPR